MKILIDIPGEPDIWDVARAVLEAVEEGSSTHCVEQLYDSSDNAVNGYRHHRLGVRVQQVPDTIDAETLHRADRLARMMLPILEDRRWLSEAERQAAE